MRKILLLVSAMCFAWMSNAQTFGAQVVGGLTVSQIDGDGHVGYNKIGFTAGVNALIYLQEKSYTSIGILLSQRGSQNEFNINNTPGIAQNFSLTTNYIEVPVLFHYRDWLVDEDAAFYRIDVHGGLSYGRLFSTRLKDDIGAINNIIDRLEENDLSFVVGAGYHFSEKFSLVFQFKRSITPMYNPDGTTTAAPRGFNWINHFLTGQAVYTF